MLNLAERYWAWKRNKKKNKIKTVLGHTVVKFGREYAVKAGSGRFYDLNCPDLTWGTSSRWFADCLGSKNRIERRFGSFIEYKDKDE